MANETEGAGGGLGFGTFFAKLREWYQILFVPYAIVFIPYVVLGSDGAVIAFYSGVNSDNLKFKWIPLGIAAGFLVMAALTILRRIQNRRARLQSLNKMIRVLEEKNGLHFRENGYVDYCQSLKISPLNNNDTARSMAPPARPRAS